MKKRRQFIKINIPFYTNWQTHTHIQTHIHKHKRSSVHTHHTGRRRRKDGKKILFTTSPEISPTKRAFIAPMARALVTNTASCFMVIGESSSQTYENHMGNTRKKKSLGLIRVSPPTHDLNKTLYSQTDIYNFIYLSSPFLLHPQSTHPMLPPSHTPSASFPVSCSRCPRGFGLRNWKRLLDDTAKYVSAKLARQGCSRDPAEEVHVEGASLEESHLQASILHVGMELR